MKANELLKYFPEKSFSEIWEEKIKNIKSFHPQIDENEINNFKNNIKRLFILDKKINTIIAYFLKNYNIEISEDDFEIIKINGINIINSIIGMFNNPNLIDITKKNLLLIFEKINNELTLNGYLSNEYKYNPRGGNPIYNGKKIIDNNIEELDKIFRLIKLENEKNTQINNETLEKINKLITDTNDFEKKYPEITKKMDSFLEFEKNITKKEVSKIGDFYTNKGKDIKLNNEKVFKYFIRWKNSDWIWLSIIFGKIILIISYINIINQGKMIVSTIPLIATVSIFIIFFLKQYSNNKNLINSYEFKGVSAEVMEYLLGTRENTEEGKIILEKTLDKILEDPSKNDKGTNETINLINTSLKTPGN